MTQVQDLSLGFVYSVHLDPLLEPIQVSLDGMLSHTTQLGVINKLAESALDPIIYVVNKDVEEYEISRWSTKTFPTSLQDR